MAGGATALRALDHLVLPCADLAAAARAYEALGFTVGRRNRHPWGTENHIIQFPGAFLELIALATDYAPLDPADDAFPFAGFLAGQGASRNPAGLLVLRSEDAAADAARFQAAGIGSHRMLDFARAGQGPDGTMRTVAFTLAFAEAPVVPNLGFFACQQRHPENFWNPAMQRHPNGVTGLAAVTLAVPHPAALADFLERFTGAERRPVGDRGLAFALAEGTTLVVEAMPPSAPATLSAIGFSGTGGPRDDTVIGGQSLVFGR